MLRKEVGDRAFGIGLRHFVHRNRFQVASWRDLQKSFENAAGRELGWFFDQWVTRPGVASLAGTALATQRAAGGYRTAIEIEQREPVRRLEIPVVVKAGREELRRTVTLRGVRATLQVDTKAKPESVVLDPDYDVLRLLDQPEMLPTLGQLDSADDVILVLPRGPLKPYEAVIARFQKRWKITRPVDPLDFPRPAWRDRPPSGPSPSEQGLRQRVMRDVDTASVDELRKHSVLVLGRENPALARILGDPSARVPDVDARPGFSVTVMRHPADPEKVVAILDSSSAEETALGLSRIQKMRRYSRVAILHGTVLQASMEVSARGAGLDLGFADGTAGPATK
jgi:hypothetical protein